jgi:hypothetical protein
MREITKDDIGTGDPKFSGRYACFMHGVAVVTVIRFWCVGQGWLNNLQEPVAGTVAGWIGPLPCRDLEEGMRPAPPLNNGHEPSMKFDL